MFRTVSLLLLCLGLLWGCAPKADAGRWLKGNTHTHSLWSDGNDFPEMIALWYRDRGYDFLVLSDHNVLQQGERWMKLSDVAKRGGQEALGKYTARLGEKWVRLRGEEPGREVRLKNLDEIRQAAERPGFLMIAGEELTDNAGKKPIHTNAMNLAEPIGAQGGKDVRDVMRRNILAVEAQAQRLHRPILPHLNHPNFGYAITAEDIAHVVEEEFFEIYNGHPGVGHYGDANHPPVEKMWDIANTIRIAELKNPPLYCVGTDDAHQYHGKQSVTPGKGWIMVHATSLSAEPIIHAMRGGDFYASSGVTLEQVQYKNGELSVKVQPDGDAQYTIEFIGTMKGYNAASTERLDAQGEPVTRNYSGDVGKVLKTVQGTSGSYKLTGKELYVRAAIRSSKPPQNPSYPNQIAEAWTQPVGWEKQVEAKTTIQHFHQHPHEHQ